MKQNNLLVFKVSNVLPPKWLIKKPRKSKSYKWVENPNKL